MNTRIIIHPENKEQLRALKVFMKALKIPFEIRESIYDPEFVAMIKQGDKDIKEGKGVKLSVNNLFS